MYITMYMILYCVVLFLNVWTARMFWQWLLWVVFFSQKFQEMYDLDGDQNEFKNLATTIPQNEKKEYLNLIEHMEQCSGASCHV